MTSTARSSSRTTGDNWFAEVGALKSPDAVWILRGAVAGGGVFPVSEVEARFGSDGQRWIALGRIMRAGYIREGGEKLHISLKGRRALAALDSAE